MTERLLTLTLRKAVGLIVGVATVLALTAAVLERLIDPAFDTLPQALWFAVTTVSTVGYGDYVPESGAGRVVAAALMLTGLGLIPLITSVVVSILVAQRSHEAREQELRHLTTDPRAARQPRAQDRGARPALAHARPGGISPNPHDDSRPRRLEAGAKPDETSRALPKETTKWC